MPVLLFFDDELFTYTVKQKDLEAIIKKVSIHLSRAAIVSPMGEIAAQGGDFLISLELAGGLHKLASKLHSTEDDKAEKIEDLYKKSLHKENKFLALGLKGLLRREAGMIRFCALYSLA
jgi:hypothetical protein